MPKPLPDFVAHCCELMRAIGVVRARAMMGGYMLKCDDAPVGVIAWDTLFFKVDDETKPKFLEAGGKPFRYEKQEEKNRGKVIEISYITSPPDALESEEEMAHWARLGIAAARRAATKKSAPKTAEKSTAAAAKPCKCRSKRLNLRRRYE